MTQSARLNLLREDIKAVIKVCKDDLSCPFDKFDEAELCFSFAYTQKNGKKCYFTFNFSEDYPENTMMSKSDDSEASVVVNDRLVKVFGKLAKELYKELDIPSPSCTKNGANNELCNPTMDRMESIESNYTDCTDYTDCTSDFEDYEYYQDDYEHCDEDLKIHPLLETDIENVKNLYGADSIDYRPYESIDDVDVELKVMMSFLDNEIAKAWKVLRDIPIVVRLHLSLSRYLDATKPKVEVFQTSQKEKFGIGSQLRKILETFISENWDKISNESVRTAQKEYSQKQDNFIKKTINQVSSLFNTSPDKSQSSSSGVIYERSQESCDFEPIDDGAIAKIMEMGYSSDIARNALIISKGNVEEALNLVISNPDGLLDGCHTYQEATPAVPPKPQRRSKVSKSFTKSAAKSPSGAQVADLVLQPSSTKSGKNAKRVPSIEHGFLVQMLRYVSQRLPTLNEFCVVCDEPHVFQNGAMLKPAVCARELCVFGFQTLGVMSDAAEDIATGAEVVDLLINMATCACRSHRKNDIFNPFPTVIDPHCPTELALHPKKKDFDRVDRALQAFITVDKMTTLAGSDLKKNLDQKDALAYPLLQWIIASNRSHIVKLPSERQVSFMRTPHQFLLMSSPPAKEAVFRSAKQKYGSLFAFHGSHMENWHSIMREGLINASGTKFQMHGAAYGKGIYLSPSASVSFGYSGMGVGYHKPQSNSQNDKTKGRGLRFLKSQNLTCIALCEVINHEIKKSGNIWVMPNPDHVCTRFFFVYEDGQVGDPNINTQEDSYKKEIMRAVQFQTH